MNILNYIFVALLFVAVDSIWLYLGSGLSQSMIKDIQGSPLKLRMWPGAVVYIALAYLVTIPKNNTDAFLLGFASYAIYDFTNYAILDKYSLQFAVMDTTWGGILMTVVWNLSGYFKLLN
jgi:uncharacterized membrane protein